MAEAKMGTVTVSARIDIFTFEAAARFLISQGDTPATRSDLVWRVMEYFVQAAEAKGLVQRCTDVYEVTESLNAIGLGVQRSDRNRRQLARTMQQQTMQDDFHMSGAAQSRVTKKASTREERYQMVCALRERGGLPIMSREDFNQMEDRERHNGYMDSENPAQAYVQPAPADLAEQVAQAEARQKAERAALLQVPTCVVVSAPAKPVEDV